MIAHADVSPYIKMVGRVNLAAVFIATERWHGASECLSENIQIAQSEGLARLEGNCREMQAQIAIHQRDFSSATHYLKDAERLLTEAKTFDHFLVAKWSAFIKSLKERDLAPVCAFKASAAQRADWESVRDTDRIALQIQFDEQRFNHLFFGTPYSSYRQLLVHQFARCPNFFRFTIGNAKAGGLDLATGHLDQGTLKAGKKVHQVLSILTRDFYRPANIGELFAGLFPDDYFDIFNSPDRVHQTLYRARGWITKSALPLEIREESGSYRLILNNPNKFALHVPLRQTDLSSHGVHLVRLQNTYKSGEIFSPLEARNQLGLTRSTFQRFARWAVAEGKFERIGTNTSKCAF